MIFSRKVKSDYTIQDLVYIPYQRWRLRFVVTYSRSALSLGFLCWKRKSGFL